ncbi:glycosyltransferase [Caballeronia sp. Sq4a]|uniref:glycosyltransferase n=1 Tax=Caballeronia sp. Sq4a TaxID=2878152 RepID=UPI0020BEF081|nr:glycosyltransferase [Caballeronia sp. Sq4a]
MKITAVVVTRNRPALLVRVLDALSGQSLRPGEVIVFDNASDEATRDMLSTRHDATVLRSDYNIGGAGGFARGVQHALARGADWVWLLDDDAVPHRDALQRLVAARALLPADVGALCPSVDEFGAVALQHRRYFDSLFGRERTVAASAYNEFAVRIDTGSFVGFLADARAVWAAGLPRADYFSAYDDTEFSLRLKAVGFSVWLVPESRIDHLREIGARLRNHSFGPRHYYNVRNRIAVSSQYARWPLLAALRASVVGVALWMISSHPWQVQSMEMLVRALADGHRRRLGEIRSSTGAADGTTVRTTGY